MEHSKGKWQARSLNYLDNCEIFAGDLPIAHISMYGSETERRANAQLIAAAPDMLEALKLLRDALTEYRLRDVKKRYSLCVADGIASNAIFKAEGGK